MVPSPAKMRIFWMYVSMDLADVSSFGMLHQRSPLGASCLEIPRSDGIQSGAPVFLFDRLVLEGALRSSAGYNGHTTRFLISW
jgi:hypothetical protein